MKNTPYVILVFMVCNVCVSQEKPITENDSTKVPVFKFYPNPAEDELFVLGVNKIKSIELIDVLGKQVAIHHFNKSIIKMDVSEIKSGLYLMLVTDKNGKQETKRLIIK